MKQILIIEDDINIAELEKEYLQLNGYKVEIIQDGIQGLKKALIGTYDLIIVDLMLPGKDGYEIVREVREKYEIPIIIVSARSEDIDKIKGLGFGADDYLTKPFSPREVLARMKAIFRRLKPTTTEPLQEDTPKAPLVIGEIRVDEQNYEVFVRNQPIELTPKEFELLVYFMKRKDRVINRETLLERIWQYDFAGQSRIVDVHISHLRDKIEPDPKRPVYLVTVRGFGYRFQEPKR